MDGNILLLVFVALSGVMLLAQTLVLRLPFRAVRPQLLLTAAVQVVTVAAWFVIRPAAGYIGIALWGVLFLLPVLLARLMQRLVTNRRFRVAFGLARLMRWIQPWGAWAGSAEMLRRVELARVGRFDEALALLEAVESRGGPAAVGARIERTRLTGDWAALLAWFAEQPPQEFPGAPELRLAHLRALGETGDVQGMLRFYSSFQLRLSRAQTYHLAQAWLFALAFSGRVAGTARLSASLMRSAPANIRTYWLARARIAAGDEERGRRELAALVESPALDADARASAVRALEQPSTPFTATEAETRLLERVEAEVEHAIRYGALPATTRPWATFGIVAANVAMFLAEIQQGGSEDGEVLLRLGALVPEEIHHGGWWRLGAAMFLHMGPWHLGMNMLGLLVLGPLLERFLGSIRFAVVYLVSGLLSMVCIYLAAAPEDQVVGASGAVMALVGATAAAMLYGARREQSPVASIRLRVMLLIVGLQVVFDQVVNHSDFFFGTSDVHVSSMGHLSGAAIGFVVTASWLFATDGLRASPRLRSAR